MCTKAYICRRTWQSPNSDIFTRANGENENQRFVYEIYAADGYEFRLEPSAACACGIKMHPNRLVWNMQNTCIPHRDSARAFDPSRNAAHSGSCGFERFAVTTMVLFYFARRQLAGAIFHVDRYASTACKL